jgi:putative membrane protein insertion efficiency factor
MKKFLKTLISIYQIFISPLFPPSCRFHPSCSRYAAEAIDGHGALKGAYLSMKRILRCHPFNAGGYDPVPAGRLKGFIPGFIPCRQKNRLKKKAADNAV